MYCAPGEYKDCASDSDCPREFECVDAPVSCTEIDCPEDAPDCNRCTAERKLCQPRQIECDTSDQCPAEWSCIQQYDYQCSGTTPIDPDNPTVAPPEPDSSGSSGTGSTPSSGAGTDNAEGGGDSGVGGGDSSDSDPDREDGGCVEVPTTAYCSPDAFEGFGRVEGSVDLGGEATGAPEEGSGDSNSNPMGSDGEPAAPSAPKDEADADDIGSAGGCSHTPTAPWGGAGSLLLLFGALLPLLRRRRDCRAS
jgi:hypothetical protein